MGSREHLKQLSREQLIDLAAEQNDKLKELLTHFRALQDENQRLKARETEAVVSELRQQLQHRDGQVADMEAKIAALVAKTRELLEDYRRLQQEHTDLLAGRSGGRDRGVSVAPVNAEVEALRAENSRLRQQLSKVQDTASHAAADTAEVTLLRERVRQLEHSLRDHRQRLHDAAVRADKARDEEGSPKAAQKDASKPSSTQAAASPTKAPTTQQVAGFAAACVGGGGKAAKRSLNLEGPLFKQGGGWGPFKSVFKERYFELRGAQGTLYYFAKRGGEQLGDIPLEGASVAPASLRPHAFCIFGPMLPRTYILAASCEEECKRWTEAIQHAADHYTAYVRGTPAKGHLEPAASSQAASCIATVVEDVEGASCVYGGSAGGAVQATDKAPALQDFELLVVVGVGSFGKVLKVRHKGDKRIYAMKVLQKDNIVKNHMVPHTKAERDILEAIDHPFIVKLHYAFQTRHQLVFILDFLTGGELFFHLANEHHFSEPRSRFYAAEIALALDHLHGKNIIYRDLKPENLVLDGQGHVILTDFGLAKTEVVDVTHTFCGTPQYMAPELILKQGHGRAADWWSLGVFLFEMIAGVAPFPNQGNVRQLYEAIVSHPPPFPKQPMFSPEARDCCTRMLAKDPSQRISALGTMRQTAFFKPLDIDAVLRKAVPVPFKPQHRGDDTRYVDAEFKRERVDVGPGVAEAKEGATIVFDDFTFVRTTQ
eukprot:TRINITY_DN60270_c0_g1_i1.p1 TRINITY_DN60270_c0_g1~~TRINITY_DN60270_c0_g1_i1.p1  ORF type:complete len:744 (+),score=247.49 TRINITY_DN60270_c0_g1_i1:94-2232(+)